MFIILSIVALALIILILSFFKGNKKLNGPEAFLDNLGYSYKLVDEKKILIPKNFGENMQKYNKLQNKQGFDLKKYAGKVCVQKKYAVTGYEELKTAKAKKAKTENKNSKSDQNIADLIVFDGAVVGGALHCPSYGSSLKELDSLNRSKK